MDDFFKQYGLHLKAVAIRLLLAAIRRAAPFRNNIGLNYKWRQPMATEGQAAPHPDDTEISPDSPRMIDNPTIPVYNEQDEIPSAPRPAVRKMSPRFWNSLIGKIGDRLDHRDEPRWEIAGGRSFSEKGSTLVITDTHGEEHAFDKSKINAFHLEPLASRREQIDLIIWEKREGTSSIRPIYAGTFDYQSDALGKIRTISKDLGLR